MATLMRKPFLIVLAFAAIVTIVLESEQNASREPMYRGRRLRDWISTGYGKHPDPAVEREAVLACGTNAIPYYLKLLQTRPVSGLKDKLGEFLARHRWPRFGLTSKTDKTDDFFAAEIGAEGLGILGPAASSAAPALIKLVREGDSDSAVPAGRVLARTGEGAMLIRNMLCDPRGQKRFIAGFIVGAYADPGELPYTPRSPAEIKQFASILVPVLISRLGGSNFDEFLGDALATFAKSSEIVVPALVDSLQNTNNNMTARCSCAWTLREIGPGAKAAVPALLAAFNEPDGGLRRAAGEALTRIDNTAGAEVVKRYTALIQEPNLKIDERSNLVEELGRLEEKSAAGRTAKAGIE